MFPRIASATRNVKGRCGREIFARLHADFCRGLINFWRFARLVRTSATLEGNEPWQYLRNIVGTFLGKPCSTNLRLFIRCQRVWFDNFTIKKFIASIIKIIRASNLKLIILKFKLKNTYLNLTPVSFEFDWIIISCK